MKSTIKLLMTGVVLAITNVCIAQVITLKAGLNLAEMMGKDDFDDYSKEYKMKPGFHVGGTVDFPISRVFSFEPGLLVSTKGFKLDMTETEPSTDSTFGYSIDMKMKYNLVYLDIPLNIKATFDIGKAKLTGSFGPYLGIGLFGKAKGEASFNFFGITETEKYDEDIIWGSGEDDDMKRIDYGLNAGVGVEVNSVMFNVSYGLGLANILPKPVDGEVFKNRVLAFTFGYILNGKNKDR